MQRFTIFAFCIVLAGSMTLCLAASPSIGMVIARGGFQIDNARVSGNATLFDGTVVQTGRSAGELELNSGTRVELSSDSRGRIYRDRMVLEQGEGRLNGSSYQIEARTLRVTGDEPNATARVSLTGNKRVQVAALTGSLRVTNAHGLLVANLLMGAAMEFEPQAEGAAIYSKLTGIVKKQGGKYFLTDETTKVTVELRGKGVESMAGKRVEVDGSVDAAATPAQGAAEVVNVQTVTQVAKGAAAAGAGSAAGSASAAGATSAGVSVGTVAIVGGVAAAGTVTGLGITGSLPGQGNSSNSSR